MRHACSRLVAAGLAAAVLLVSWVSLQGELESQLHIVPLDDVILRSELRDLRVFVLSGDKLLVEALPSEMDRVAALSSAFLGTKGMLPLWVGPLPIPDEFLKVGLESGEISFLHVDMHCAIFRASPEGAYLLYQQGYPITRVRFNPLSKLQDIADARPVFENLKGARPLTPARLDFMRSMAESVSTDSLRNLIYFLNYDPVAGEYRSRFAARYDLDEDVMPVLRQRLDDYLGPAGGQVYLGEFDLHLAEKFKGQSDRGTNVIGEKRGTKTSAHYIVCAHFDATASRDDGFDTTWVFTPAPGANDNATGTAAVIECARLIAPLSLDFGVTFALFSAEENLGLGSLRGSEAYVDLLADSDSIIGVINLDMVGYSEDFKKAEISYGWRSEWLSSELETLSDSLLLETAFEGLSRPDVRNSDHASFWRVGIPALMLSDRNQDDFPIPIYPYYHSAADTLGNLDMVQVRDNVALVVAHLSRFADIPGDSLCDIEVTPASIEFSWEGRSSFRPMVAGTDLTINVRALNTGGPMAGPTAYMLRVWRGEDGSGTPLHESPVSLNVVSGGIAEAEATWKTSTEVYGNINYFISLLPVDDDVESDLQNNETVATVTISPITTALDHFHVYPNPVSDPNAAHLTGDISTSRTDFLANYIVEVYDVTGLLLLTGGGQIGSTELDIPLSSLTGDASQLVPGLYVCIIKMNVRDETEDLFATARFGVVSGPR